jgi:hypothetical protein
VGRPSSIVSPEADQAIPRIEMAGQEGDRKPIDSNSIPGLVIVVREEQLSIQRRLSEALDRIAELEREVKQLKEREHQADPEHDISSG